MQPKRLLLIASLAAATAMATVPSWAASDETSFDGATVRSFAGAVLAGRTAETDRDLDTAISLYRKALRFEPDNADIKQRLMVLLFNNGMFDEGVAIADELKGDPLLENVVADGARHRRATPAAIHQSSKSARLCRHQ